MQKGGAYAAALRDDVGKFSVPYRARRSSVCTELADEAMAFGERLNDPGLVDGVHLALYLIGVTGHELDSSRSGMVFTTAQAAR